MLNKTASRTLAAIALVIAALAAALAVSGCGNSVDPALVKQAGAHGNALEKVYVLYNKDVLATASTRDLKNINRALAARDLKKATQGDVRRAQSAIQSRIRLIERYVRQLKSANRTLKNTPAPDWATGLDDSVASKQFADAYSQTTKDVQRATTRGLAAIPYAFASLERYLDFLNQWEQYLNNGDTTDLVSTGEASDKALARLKRAAAAEKRGGTLGSKISPQVDAMASAASDSSQLTDLIDQLKKDYPKSFLAVHIVEKK